MNAFVLLLPEPAATPPEQALPWARVAAGRVLERGEHPLAQLAGRIRRGDRVLVVVPGERVLLQHVTIPARSRAAQLQALPYALEDRLSEDLEALHIVPGARRPDGKLLAAVAAHRDVDTWRDWLDGAGITPDWLLPDTALLAPGADRLHIHCDDQRCLVAPPATEPMAMGSELLPWWLEQWLAQDGHEHPVEWHGLSDRLPPVLAGHPALTQHDWAGDWLALLTPALTRRPGLNLLSGRHARTGVGAATWAQWRVPATIAAVLALLWTGSLWLEVRQLEREVRQANAAIGDLFEATLPGTRMVDPVRQFQQVLEAGAAGAGGLAGPVTERLAHAAPILARSGVELRQLRADGDRLELELDLASIAELDALRTRLSESGDAQVRILGAESGDDGVRARLQIDGGGS